MSLNYTRVLVPDIPYVCPETGQRLTARFILTSRKTPHFSHGDIRDE